MTKLRSLSDLFKAARKLAVVCAFTIAIATAVTAQTNTFPSTGNAGAGTTSPDRKLESQDSGSPQLRLTHTDGSVYTDFQTNNWGQLLISPTGVDATSLKPISIAADSDAFRFYPNADTNLRWSLSTDASGLFHIVQKGDSWANQGTRFSINRSGNVGIGTSNPSAKLHLQRDVNGDNSIYVLNNGGGTSSRSLILFGEEANDAKYGYFGHFGANYAGSGPAQPRTTLLVGADSGGFNLVSYGGVPQTGGKISFWTAPDVAGGGNETVAERMRITSNGNVGVGTTSPNQKLSVAGMGAFYNSTPVTPTGVRGLFMGNFSTGSSIWSYDYSSNQADPLFITAQDINLSTYSGVNSINRLYISNAGSVGINTTTPNASYKLDVNGEINATGIRINGTPIPTGGGSSQWTTSGSNIYYNGGNVGMGFSSPRSYATLDVNTSNNKSLYTMDGTYGGLLIGYQGSTIQARQTNDGNSQNLILQNWGGNVGIGTPSPASGYKLDVNGNTNVTGNLNVTGNINAKYQDVADWVLSSEQLAAGTVVVLDANQSNQVISSTAAYDTRVAGVISAQPGIILGESGEGKVLVATTGRVRVKVDASRKPIQIGDLLVTSDVTGVAMKSEAVNLGGVQIHRPGTIIGKALEPLAKGKGEILVLLSLQ